jgi:hypothetical protein
MRLQVGCRRYPSDLQGFVREVNARVPGRLYSFSGVGRLTPAVTRTVSMRPAALVVKTEKGSLTGALFYCTRDFNSHRLSSTAAGRRGWGFWPSCAAPADMHLPGATVIPFPSDPAIAAQFFPRVPDRRSLMKKERVLADVARDLDDLLYGHLTSRSAGVGGLGRQTSPLG